VPGLQKFRDVSPVEFLLLGDERGFRKYRKVTLRDKEERKILLELALKKIIEAEKENFIIVGYRKRKFLINS
jgi:hypothetical protein